LDCTGNGKWLTAVHKAIGIGVKESADKIAEGTNAFAADIGTTDIENDVNEMSSRGGEASGAAASGPGGDGPARALARAGRLAEGLGF